jgi:thiol-disulfide isomerase/thioredoxin
MRNTDSSTFLRRARRLATTALAVTALGLAASASASKDVSGPAPDFTLPAQAASAVQLSKLRGQVVMINFWATWCGPCRTEFPLLEQLYKKYKPVGFTLLGVNVEDASADPGAWLKTTPVTFPVLFDRKNEVSVLYGVSAMPTTVLVDRKGNVRWMHRGYKPGDENEYLNQVRALLRE